MFDKISFDSSLILNFDLYYKFIYIYSQVDGLSLATFALTFVSESSMTLP